MDARKDPGITGKEKLEQGGGKMEAVTHNLLMEKQRNRQSNFELLRIAAMVMIVFYHFAGHGGFEYAQTSLSVPKLWIKLIGMGGKIGVNLFVMISGYFLIQDTTEINPKKVLKLWGCVLFYSVILGVGSVMYSPDISQRLSVWNFLPIMAGEWWFASTYFVLFLIHPYLNLLLHAMDKGAYQRYLLLLLFLWCLIPTVFGVALEYCNLLWFVTLYSLAGYIRLFGLHTSWNRYFGILAIAFSALTYARGVAFPILAERWPFFSKYALNIYEMNKLPVFLASVCLFMVFANWTLPCNPWINLISSATFGVYLIHDNGFVRHLLWRVVFRNAQYQDSLLLIPYSVAVVCVVYAGCTLMDLLRQATVERIYMGVISRNIEKISSGIHKVVSCIQRVLFGGCA